MTAGARDAYAVAVALQLAEEDRWSPPASAPVMQMPHALVPDYTLQVRAPVEPPSVLFVSPRSTPRPKRRARMLIGRGRKGKR
jgi:hypothetical protein